MNRGMEPFLVLNRTISSKRGFALAQAVSKSKLAP